MDTVSMGSVPSWQDLTACEVAPACSDGENKQGLALGDLFFKILSFGSPFGSYWRS